MPPGATERRVYTPEFKAEAVELHRGGESLEDVAAALDVSIPVLRTWVLQSELRYAGDGRPTPTPAPAPVKQPVAAQVAAPVASGPMKHCVVCGRGPALDVSLRSVTGIVIAFRMRRIKGTFCRDCGMAMSRRVLDRTLLTGWWGLFFASFATIYAAILDSTALGRFKRAPEPIGEPKAEPLKPGRSMFQRAGVYVGGVVMLFSVVIGLAVIGTQSVSALDGKCVAFTTTRIVAKPCSQSHDARVIGVESSRALCPDATDATTRLKIDDRKVVCLDLDQ
jgi:transposase-like protein